MSDVQAERIARNDATFREANERIGSVAEEIGIEGCVPFICECADPDCTEIVQLSLEEHEAVRAAATLFFNTPGHQTAAQGYVRVVDENDRYVVVEKIERAAEVATELDPRTPA